MTLKKTNQYLEVQVQTASKEQLLLMLFDGALRFCELAKLGLQSQDIENSHKNLVRAKSIVVELLCSLDKKVGEALYYNLIRLYNFVYLRLVEANFNKNPKALDEAMVILASLRETWKDAVRKNSEEGFAQTYHEKPAVNLNIQG